MSVAVVGVDPSLTGTAIYTEAHGAILIRPKAKAGPARLSEIAARVRDMAELAELKGDDALVIVEGYSHASKFQAHALGELGGVLRVDLYRAGIPYIDVAPTKRAMFATGKGNANKAAVVSAVASRTGLEFRSDDEADALVLYCLGRELLGLEHPLGRLPQTHRRALDGLTLPEGLAA